MADTNHEKEAVVRSLFQQAANVLGSRLPFEAIELCAQRLGKKMSDEAQLAVMKASFPVDKSLVRRYAYLSRSSCDGFSDLVSQQGMATERFAVRDLFQIGSCLTGKIRSNVSNEQETVAYVFFDRQRVTSMLCSEHTGSSWCPHVVALTLYRMDNPEKVKYRLPVSESVQRLSESEQKQFINMLLSHHPLEMLAFAQETLDELLTRKHSSKVVSESRDVPYTSLVNVPDLTAGGSVDDEGLWSIDYKKIRLISRAIFQESSCLGRSVLPDRYAKRFNSWVFNTLQESMDKSNWAILSMFDTDGTIADKKATSSFPAIYRAADAILQCITDLTKRGERSAIAALSIMTEEWLKALARKEQEMATHSNQSNNVTLDRIPGSQSQSQRHVKTVGFLSAMRSFFFPDKLAVCWKRAALGSITDDDLAILVRHRLIDLAKKVDDLVSVALTRVEKETTQNQTTHSVQTDRVVWNSLSGWNGFLHVAALLHPTVCKVFRAMSENAITVITSSVLSSTSSGFKLLYTAAYVALCLMECGVNKAAETLAKQCIISVLAPTACITDGVDCDSEKEVAPEGMFSVVAQCHEEIFALLWGDNHEDDLVNALSVLFNAIQEHAWAWSSIYMWNVAPWFNTSLATGSSQFGIVDSMLNSVIFVAPAAVMLGLLCVILTTDVSNSSAIEQVLPPFDYLAIYIVQSGSNGGRILKFHWDLLAGLESKKSLLLSENDDYTAIAVLVREKNRILSVMFEHMNEMNDDVIQQISQLAPFLEQNISRLDAPSSALLFLHCSVLLNSECGDDRKTEQSLLLSATAAMLRQQTVTLVGLLSEVSSVNFRLYETQCAASTLMALATYAQSKEDLNFVFCCLTKAVFERLQETHFISDSKTTESESSRLLGDLSMNETNLNYYLSDMVSIIRLLCDTNYKPVISDDQIPIFRRLSLLNSPMAELIENITSSQLLPSLVTERLEKKMKQNASIPMWETALELLLFLLQVDYTLVNRKMHRRSIIKLLQVVARQVGAVSFLEVVAKNWNIVFTAEELFTYFVKQQDFQESFVRRKEECVASTIATFKDIFIRCIVDGSTEYSTVYKAACHLEIVEDVVATILTASADLQQKVSHEFLFLLARHSSGQVTATERMQVGFVALKHWLQHCSLLGNSLDFKSMEYGYVNEEDTAIVGCLRLVALAVRLDNQLLSLHCADQQTIIIESNRVQTVTDLLTIILQDFIDPLISFVVLVEICRMLHLHTENAFPNDDSLHLETLTLPTFQETLSAQDEFTKTSNAQVMFNKLCSTVHVAKLLAQKCQSSIIEFLVNCKQLVTNSEEATKKGGFKPDVSLDRSPWVRDFISLEFLCKVFPVDGFDFETLLTTANGKGSEEHCKRHHDYGYNFQASVEEFKRFRTEGTMPRQLKLFKRQPLVSRSQIHPLFLLRDIRQPRTVITDISDVLL